MNKMSIYGFRVLVTSMIFSMLVSCTNLSTITNSPQDSDNIYYEFYVDTVKGNDSNPGTSEDKAFKTIEGSRDAVRKINGSMSEDIIIYLRGGMYTISSEITLEPEDSGTNGYNIIYKAYDDETPVISGGEDISSEWVLHDEDLNIYKKTGVSGTFRQLYVNGRWAVRARYPNVKQELTGNDYNTLLNTQYPFQVNADELGFWVNNGTTELVWKTYWSQYRGIIDSYESDGSISTVYFKNPDYKYDSHIQQRPAYYLENAYEFLEAEGEWFHDVEESTIYYKPRSDENILTAEIIVPRVDILINIEGTETANVNNVQFYGIKFMHNNWTAPSEYGYVSGQGGHMIQTGSLGQDLIHGIFTPAPGAVNIKNAENIRIERCIFKNGGSWGIMQQENSQHNEYIGNVFEYLASGAIAVGNTNTPVLFYNLPSGTASHTLIKNNLIDSVGYYYRETPGIIVLKSKNVTITNNEIRNLPYSGISLGYEWDDTGRQDSHDNLIAYNRIHNVMLINEDGGGIYTLGNNNGSIISYNYISSFIRSQFSYSHPVASIYLDASSYWTVEHNVSDFTTMAMYVTNPPQNENVGRNNYFNNSYLGHISGFEEWSDNTSYNGIKWSEPVREIIRNSGIEPEYRDIGDVKTGENVALFGVASSSTDSSDTSPSNANDNDPFSQHWSSASSDTNPWWQVDLGNNYRIYSIKLIAMLGADNPDNRKNIAILASNDPEFSDYIELDFVGDNALFQPRGVYSSIITDANKYRYIRINRISGEGAFTIAQCMVYGIP